MADTPETPDTPEPATVPAPTYTVSQHGQERRLALQQQWLEERAQWLRHLVALVPMTEQAEAMGVVMRLEHAHTREEDAVTGSWLQEVRLAYVTGRAEVATEDLQRITGEPATAGDEPPARLH